MSKQHFFTFLLYFVFLVNFSFAEKKHLDENITWSEDFHKINIHRNAKFGWKTIDLHAEKNLGFLRIRENGKSSQGFLQRIIPVNKDSRYLQIRIDGIENINQNLHLYNASNRNFYLGPLHSGINTFDLANQPFYRKNGNFLLSIKVLGKEGSKTLGAWSDIDWVRVVKTPTIGTTVSILSSKIPNLAQVGDKLVVDFYVQKTSLPKVIYANSMILKNMEYYSFGKKPLVLTRQSDGHYRGIVDITKNANEVITTKKNLETNNLIFAIKFQGYMTYATVQFPLKIKTGNIIKISSIKAKTPLTRYFRQLWFQKTQGKNLALGLPVIFSEKPNYRLTQVNGKDDVELTDGKLSTRTDDRIWFSANSVGWRGVQSFNLLIDLKKKKRIEKIVLRILGGAPQPSIITPTSIEIFVSKDNKKFYSAAKLVKLLPGEKAQSNWDTTYFLPEDGEAFVYPFDLKIRATGRYVGIKIIGSSDFIVMDEIAVIEGKNNHNNRLIYQKSNQRVFTTRGVTISPLKPQLTISTNIYTPNWFGRQGYQYKGKKADSNILYLLDLPEGVSIKYPKPITNKKVIIKNISYTRLTFKTVKLRWGTVGPFYFNVDKLKMKKNAIARFSATTTKYPNPIWIEKPISLIEIPKVPKLKKLHVSIAWMGMAYLHSWPNAMEAYSYMGFNSVPYFPRTFKNKKISEKDMKIINQFKKRKFSQIINLSPFYIMGKGSKRAGHEIFTQIPDKPNKFLCPSYRGRFYLAEIKRVGDCYDLIKPDYVFYDIECWYNGARNASKCSRCLKKQKASGLNMSEFLIASGTETFKDMKKEIIRRAKRAHKRAPLFGSYNNHSTNMVHHMVNDFSKIYPKYVDMAMPSLYTQGNVQIIHDTIKSNYNYLKTNKIIPWLSAGTYGEFESKLLEPIIYESFLNGSNGITYFSFANFDTPLDFYYHSLALKNLQPYEKLIANGKLIDIKNSNKNITISAIQYKNELLILLGNYSRTSQNKTIVTLPNSNTYQIYDVISKKDLNSSENLEITIPTDKIFRLFHFKLLKKD